MLAFLLLLAACGSEKDTGPVVIDADGDGVPAGEDCDDANSSIGWPLRICRDVDGDSYGDPYDTDRSCEVPEGWSDVGMDCDDTDAAVNPSTRWYQDVDLDGYGDPATEIQQCEAPAEGWVMLGGDCDDAEDDTHPNAPEVCNGIDDDCDVIVDEECVEPGF